MILTHEQKQEVERLEHQIRMLSLSDKRGKNHVLQQQIANLKSRLERARMGI